MRVGIDELRQMVAEAVRRALTEAKRKGRKPKDIPTMTPEAEAKERSLKTRGMPGYSHSPSNDYSEPLGPANLLKRQGASNMGNWTAEGILRRLREMQLRRLIRATVAEEVRSRRA